MAIRKNIFGTELELLIDGRVDGPAAHELELEVLALGKTETTAVYVNLAAANFLCSAAIRVLLQHHRGWKARGRRFVVSRTSPEVDEILNLTGMRDLIVEPI
jgi:anti-anti-sigma factor